MSWRATLEAERERIVARMAAVGDVWGASPTVIRRMIATPTDWLDVKPIEMPIRVTDQ